MSRARISTTVDADCLARARAMGGERDSELFDRALRAYVEERVAEQERAVLTLLAYEDDPELDMPEADDDLPYEGSVPAEVVGLAKLRRRRRAAR